MLEELRDLPPDQALEIARQTVTVAREMARQAEEQLAESLARCNEEASRAV
jgi:hypothetical protein